uniref:Uncharacterized protein n=1 Tax=Rhizophora mucronata TaxID=61149 RepID=A0A2P2NFD3_RHIMU
MLPRVVMTTISSSHHLAAALLGKQSIRLTGETH